MRSQLCLLGNVTRACWASRPEKISLWCLRYVFQPHPNFPPQRSTPLLLFHNNTPRCNPSKGISSPFSDRDFLSHTLQAPPSPRIDTACVLCVTYYCLLSPSTDAPRRRLAIKFGLPHGQTNGRQECRERIGRYPYLETRGRVIVRPQERGLPCCVPVGTEARGPRKKSVGLVGLPLEP